MFSENILSFYLYVFSCCTDSELVRHLARQSSQWSDTETNTTLLVAAAAVRISCRLARWSGRRQQLMQNSNWEQQLEPCGKYF